VFLTAASGGVLVFILWDLLAQAWEIITASLGQPGPRGEHVIGPIGLAALLFIGLGVGLLSLAGYERWLTRERATHPGPAVTTVGTLLGRPGVSAAAVVPKQPQRELSPARRLALLIAVGIGLHNFGEGLALGGSAAHGKMALATLLVTGFALHNATEGFGIVAPLAADAARPGWGFLLLMGAIGGAPTLLGTEVGSQFTSEPVSLVFLTVAAGSIIYVVIQLVGIAVKGARQSALYWGIWTGIVAGFSTDLLLTAGGA
jgi:ZIP family zinc transporter